MNEPITLNMLLTFVSVVFAIWVVFNLGSSSGHNEARKKHDPNYWRD